MVKTRSANGRFEPGSAGTTKIESNGAAEIKPFNARNARDERNETAWKFIYYVIIFLIVSPWLFIGFRRNTIGNMSKKITDFYDDTFSCNSVCLCDSDTKSASEPNKPNSVNNF